MNPQCVSKKKCKNNGIPAGPVNAGFISDRVNIHGMNRIAKFVKEGKQD